LFTFASCRHRETKVEKRIMIGGKDTESSSGEEQEDVLEEDVSHDKPKALMLTK
jgi:hypothetical protein